MLEAGAEVKIAGISETNDRIPADRILPAGLAIRHRASRRRMAPEISAKRMAYSARRKRLLLSGARAREDRANFGDTRTGGRLEEDVQVKAKFGIGELRGAFEAQIAKFCGL
jgi:hypothetical protein